MKISMKTLTFIFVFSFALNFLWENLQFLLYASNNIGINNYFLLMLYASFVDAVIVLAIFLFLSLINKSINWKLNVRNILLFSIILIVISALIEINALKTGRWTYSSLMPTVFGIGLSPLIQLAVTGLISLIITRKLTSFFSF